jgi:hypothetical protein
VVLGMGALAPMPKTTLNSREPKLMEGSIGICRGRDNYSRCPRRNLETLMAHRTTGRVHLSIYSSSVVVNRHMRMACCVTALQGS